MIKPLRLIPIVAFLIASLALLPACNDIPQEFNQNQELWQSQNIKDYSYKLRIQLFSPNIYPFVVTVRNGTMAYYVAEDQNNPVSSTMISRMDTLDEVFQTIQDEDFHEPYKIITKYDSAYGFPISCSIKPLQNAPYMDWGFTISEFTPLTPELKLLEEMKQLWQSHGIKEYSFHLQVGTGFRPPRTADVNVIVKNGVYSDYEVAGEPANPNPSQITPYDTIDKLFDLLEQAYQVPGDKVTVNYDPTYGFPTYLSSYTIEGPMHINFAVYISEFKPVIVIKPIIVLQPTTISDMSVSFEADGVITYNKGFPQPVIRVMSGKQDINDSRIADYISFESKAYLKSVDYSKYFVIAVFSGEARTDSVIHVGKVWQLKNSIYVSTYYQPTKIPPAHDPYSYQMLKVERGQLIQFGDITFKLLGELEQELDQTTKMVN
jgi:hypothetical protein